MRSRSSEAVRESKVGAYQQPRHTPYRNENGSEIETLARERRDLARWLFEEANQNYALITNRLSRLFLIDILLLISLAIINVILRSGMGFTDPFVQQLWIMSEILSAVFLTASCILSLYGSVFTLRHFPTSTNPGGVFTHQQAFTLLLADLYKIRQAEKSSATCLRFAAILFAIALVLFVVAGLLLLL